MNMAAKLNFFIPPSVRRVVKTESVELYKATFAVAYAPITRVCWEKKADNVLHSTVVDLLDVKPVPVL